MGAGREQGQDVNESVGRDGDKDENGNGNGSGNRIGECRREANKRRKPHKSCSRHVGNGADLEGKSKKCS